MKDFYSHVNSTPAGSKKLPILIVAFCRAALLERLLTKLLYEQRTIYLVIDKAPENLASENNNVRLCAESFKDRLDIIIRVNEKQAGVKFGVPQAVDWVLDFEDCCIILEDDCDFSLNALPYFDQMFIHLGGDIAMITGDSPWNKNEIEHSTQSQYPLIWGWATNREQWKKMSRLIGGEIPWRRVLQSAVKKPRMFLSITYFLSAQIKVKRGQLQAWDCSVALNMLLANLKCITPNVRIIENVGDDEFAHHTFDNIDLARGRIENKAAASTVLRNDLESEKATNKAIRQRIYNMKMRQVFSPVKALLCRSSS